MEIFVIVYNYSHAFSMFFPHVKVIDLDRRLQKKVKSWLKVITEINEWEACFVKMTSNVMHQAISLVEVRLKNQSNMIIDFNFNLFFWKEIIMVTSENLSGCQF
jgi:hypothetical protein